MVYGAGWDCLLFFLSILVRFLGFLCFLEAYLAEDVEVFALDWNHGLVDDFEGHGDCWLN